MIGVCVSSCQLILTVTMGLLKPEITIALQLLLAAVTGNLSTKGTGNKFSPLQLLHCSWEWCSGRILVPLGHTASGGGQAAFPLQGFSMHIFWSARVAQTYLQAHSFTKELFCLLATLGVLLICKISYLGNKAFSQAQMNSSFNFKKGIGCDKASTFWLFLLPVIKYFQKSP